MVRADRDRWDLVTSVGATATMVAAQRALAADPRYALIDDPYAAPLVRAVGMDVYTRLVDWQIPVEGDSEFDPQRMATGMACRTRFFDQFFLDATHSGIGQFVILASGLDARAYRLAWPVGSIVYEVDMPEVIEFKTATLSDLGAEPATERRTVAVDLRDDWATALQTAGFDPKVPAAWSAEGLLVYLPVEAQDALFDNITALSAPGSRLAFEFVPDTAIFADERWRNYHNRMSELRIRHRPQRAGVPRSAWSRSRLFNPRWLADLGAYGHAVVRGKRLCLSRRRARDGVCRPHLQQRDAHALKQAI